MVHSALTQMWVNQKLAPWDFPQWQKLTGVENGLFPDDDSLLPTGWTRQDAIYISQYFDEFGKVGSEDDKIKFASGRRGSAPVAGRDLWRSWVTDLWQKKGVHAIVTGVLQDLNLHPMTIALAEGTGLDKLPNNSTYLPLAVNDVGRALFGEEACNALGHICTPLRGPTLALMQRTWINIYNQLRRSSKRIASLERAAAEAYNGALSFICIAGLYSRGC